MPTDRRRADARRRAWGRGPIILRFEPLEGRQLLSTTAMPDLAATAFDTVHNLDWGDRFQARGIVANQGTAAVGIPFHVNIYASPTPTLGTGSVLLGQVTVPAGLAAGAQAPFDQTVSLPPTALSGVDGAGSVYIGTLVDPEGAVAESNELNNAGTGQGYDTSLVTITSRKPSALVGAGLSVSPDQTAWGQTVQVTAQIANQAEGDAPATRARIVLTPAGLTPGTDADVTIGSLDVPAVAAWQTVTVSGNVTLPATPPAVLLGSTLFTLSVVQDADFTASAMSPHLATGGAGYDMTAIAIQAPANTTALVNAPRPELSVSQVKAPSLPLTLGQPFQITATVKNSGKLDAGPYRVRFLLVGAGGGANPGLFLGDATIDGLAAGSSHDVVQTLTVPTKLPSGVAYNTNQGRLAVIVDPEHTLDDANPTNNAAVSDVVTLRLVGAPETVVTPSQPTATATRTATNPIQVKRTTTTVKKATQPVPAKPPTTPVRVRPKKFGPQAPRSTARLAVFPARVVHQVRSLVKSNTAKSTKPTSS